MTPARFALLCTLALGCTKANPQYCDATVGCPTGMACDLVRRTCVDANADLTMPMVDASMPPDLAGCMTSTDCIEAAKPICDDMTKTCRPCSSATTDAGDVGDVECSSKDPTRHYCNMGKCVQCQSSADCSNPTPACDATGTCAKCTDHAQCPSLVCDSDGTCHDQSDVFYVDNNGSCSMKPSGAMNDPFCVIQDAVNKNTTKVIRVVGSSKVYPPVVFNNQSGTLVGPGRDVMPPAKISGMAAAVAVMGTNEKVSVDGFDLTTVGNADAIFCLGTNLDLTVQRSLIHGAQKHGVSSTSCRITLDQDRITANALGGVLASASIYTILNCMIVENGAFGPAVDLSTSAGGTFRHNTVAQNTNGANVGGIDCGGTMRDIENSIIWKNSQSAGSQLNGSCNLIYVDIDEPPLAMGTNRNLTPDFTADYHLMNDANNMACCIDQVPASPVDHDFDGTPRPQPANGKFDIGAHEVK